MSENIHFRTEFNGGQPEIKPEEIAYAEERFVNGIDDLLFANMACGNMAEHPWGEGENGYSYIVPLVVPFEDGSRVEIEVFRDDDYIAEHRCYGLHFTELDAQNQSTGGFMYSFNGYETDPSVRRVDFSDGDDELLALPGHEYSDEELQNALIRAAANEAENFDLERQIGVNDQPVDSEEIEKMFAFLADAQAKS